MPTVTFIHPNGEAQRVEARPGASLMLAAVSAAVRGIEAECGGSMSCGTCHVQIAEGWRDRVGPPSDDEAALLEFVDGFEAGSSRLSCQIAVTSDLDGLTVGLI